MRMGLFHSNNHLIGESTWSGLCAGPLSLSNALSINCFENERFVRWESKPHRACAVGHALPQDRHSLGIPKSDRCSFHRFALAFHPQRDHTGPNGCY